MLYLREEPSLEDVISDPIIRTLMRRDKIGEPVLRHIIEQARFRIGVGGYPSHAVNASLSISLHCAGEVNPASQADSQRQAQ